MDQKYLIGISELDTQHEEIDRLLSALGEAVDAGRQPLPALLATLDEKFKFHFNFEESVMGLASYPEIDEHQRAHQAILKSLDDYRRADAPSLGASARLPIQLFHEQVMNHDMRFARFVMAHKDRLGLS